MAGANIKDIKHRIKSVESTRQITKAMELVASSKLRRAKERAEKTRPYFEMLSQTINDIAAMNTDSASAYTERREVKNRLLIVIAGDRGLAGGYNGNVFRLSESELKEGDSVIAIGRKACDYFAKKQYPVTAQYAGIAESMEFKTAAAIAERALGEFRAGSVDEINIIYTKFVSPLTQQVMQKKLIPITAESDDSGKARELVVYEPSAEAVFESIVPDYAAGMILGAVAESFASEQGARRTAMESANDNATQMIDDLTLRFNRARQTAITQEITEIVSGANASS